MTYYADLSDYDYLGLDFIRPGTKNVGWLGIEHAFETAPPSEALLNAIWNFCKISVCRTRGVHTCEFCNDPHSHIGKRNNESLLLGTSEIRVFSDQEITFYAAPTLLYHYVSIHHYNPPLEFSKAVLFGPSPPSEEYFSRLRKLNFEWRYTTIPRENLAPNTELVDLRSPKS